MEIREIANEQNPINIPQYSNKKIELTKGGEDNKEQDMTSSPEKSNSDVMKKIIGKFEGENSELSFSVHEKTNQIMIKVVNSETKEIIKEIPSEKILDMVASMMETAGLIIDEKR